MQEEQTSVVDTLMTDLGIGAEDTNNSEYNTEESNKDFVQEPEEKPSDKTDDVHTEEPNQMDSLQKQIDVMQKRIEDKDEYINLLKEKSKEKESSESDTTETEEEDFWSNPEDTIKKMQDSMRVQDLRLNEAVFASTVKDYWKTVNQEALQEAVATDTEFNKSFNSSKEPYKTAYEYLINKTKADETSKKTLRESIKAELMAEMGIKKSNTEVPPNINNTGGSSSTTHSDIPEDGFMSVFGQN